jgi:hypothetical protein
MPTVPGYESRVERRALPGARLSPNVPEGALDGAAVPDLSGATRAVLEIAERAKQEADQIALLDAGKELSAIETDLLYNPETGALGQMGKNALGLPEKVKGEWAKRTGEVAGRLKNDQQKLMFERLRAQHESSLDQNVVRHVGAQLRVVDQETTESYLTNERAAAMASYGDPVRVRQAIDRQGAVLADFAKRQGWDSAKLEDVRSRTHSATHAGVLSRMLENNEYFAAKEYFAANKQEMVGDDLVKAEKAVASGALKGESQQRALAIVQKHGDYKTALAAVDAIADPELQEATRSQVKMRFQEQEDARQMSQGRLYLEATNLIDNNPGRSPRDVIGEWRWAQLDLSQRNALENRAEAPSKNNDGRWLSFLETDPKVIGKMNRFEFETVYWSTFDASHRSRAEERWAAARAMVLGTDGGGGQQHFSQLLDFDQRVRSTLVRAKLIPPGKSIAKLSKDQQMMMAQLDLEASKQVLHYEATQLGGSRRATGEEVQAIIDGILTQKVFVDKGWFSAEYEKPAALIQEDERGHARVPIDDIPTADINFMKRLAAQHGVSVSTRKIERAYAAYKTGGIEDAVLVLTEEGSR